MAQIIDGKKISQDIKDELKEKVTALKDTGTEVALAVIQVGNDPASSVYVRNKKKACEYIGIRSLSYELPEETTEDALIELIEKLNKDETVNGILVQLPVPKHIDPDKIIRTISPEKDVDGFHPQNVGKLVIGEEGFVSCTRFCRDRHRRLPQLHAIRRHQNAGIRGLSSHRRPRFGHRQKQYCRKANGASDAS